MASVFTMIIDGELPGRFVWKDDVAVAFLTIEPLQPGHALVVPRAEVDHWVDLEPEIAGHLMQVARSVGRAQLEAFDLPRIGLIIAGLEVPHAHLHVVPMRRETDLRFENVSRAPDAELDDAATRLRAALRAHGRAEVSD